MTAPRDELAALLARVEAATGQDRELDCAIAVAIDGFFVEPSGSCSSGLRYSYVDTEGKTNRSGGCGDMLVPLYTLSIDLALALVERLRAGWQVNLYIYSSAGAYCSLGARKPREDVAPDAKTAPLAIVKCLLTALLQSEADQGDGAGA